MSKKEILFSARLDTSAFTSQLREIQQRVQQVQGGGPGAGGIGGVGGVNQNQLQQRMQNMGISTPGGATAQQQNQAYKNSQREIQALIKEQWSEANKLNKEMETRLKTIQQIKKEEKDSTKTAEEKLELAKKLTQEEKEQQRATREHTVRMGALEKSLDQADTLKQSRPQGWNRLMAAYQGGGVAGAAKSAYRMSGGALGAGAGLLGLAASGIMLADPIIRQQAAQSRLIASAQGSAIQGLSGNLQAIYNGDLQSNLMWGPERQKAMERALAETRTNMKADQWKPWGTIGGNIAAGAAAGAAGFYGAGASIAARQWQNIPAALAGAAAPWVGAAIGGVTGLAKGGYDVYSDLHSKNIIMSQLGNKEAKQALAADYAKDIADRFNENEASEKRANPLKELTIQRYKAQVFQNLEFQRQFGMTDKDLTGAGGFFDRANDAGFTREAVMGQMSAIAAAGGGTGASKSLALAANRFATGGITNAGMLMGQISNVVGGGKESEQAFIKILAEGVRHGMNASDTPIELRKFAEAATAFAVGTGAVSEKGIAAEARQFSAFVGSSPTMNAIAQATSASNFFNQATSQTSGPSASIFAAKVMSNPELSKLTSDDRIALGQMSVADIMNPDNLQIGAMATHARMDPDKLRTILTNDKIASQGARNVTAKSLAKAGRILKNQGTFEGKEIPLDREESDVVGEAMSFYGNENSDFAALSITAKKQVIRRMGQGADLATAVKEQQAASMTQKEPGQTGQIGDKELAAIATQQSIVNENFRKMEGALGLAATASRDFVKVQMENAALLAGMMKDGKLDPVAAKQALLDMANPKTSTNTPRSGPSSGKPGTGRGM